MNHRPSVAKLSDLRHIFEHSPAAGSMEARESTGLCRGGFPGLITANPAWAGIEAIEGAGLMGYVEFNTHRPNSMLRGRDVLRGSQVRPPGECKRDG